MNTRQIFSGLFIILILSLSGTAFGQGAPKPIFGVKGGINLANVGGDTDNQMKFSDRKFNVTLRYIFGLMNVDDTGLGTRRNNVFQASLSYKLYQGI